ncbi:hypothetical protein DIPPA_19851 [Diplonema papillatum]|nr:hypothetical protein DIPPA_19851 [Diplonema papillatum]
MPPRRQDESDEESEESQAREKQPPAKPGRAPSQVPAGRKLPEPQKPEPEATPLSRSCLCCMLLCIVLFSLTCSAGALLLSHHLGRPITLDDMQDSKFFQAFSSLLMTPAPSTYCRKDAEDILRKVEATGTLAGVLNAREVLTSLANAGLKERLNSAHFVATDIETSQRLAEAYAGIANTRFHRVSPPSARLPDYEAYVLNSIYEVTSQCACPVIFIPMDPPGKMLQKADSGLTHGFKAAVDHPGEQENLPLVCATVIFGSVVPGDHDVLPAPGDAVRSPLRRTDAMMLQVFEYERIYHRIPSYVLLK